MPSEQGSTAITSERQKLRAVMVVALVLAAGVVAHVPGLNGAYWRWEWRHITGVRLFPAFAAAALPFFAAQWLRDTRRATSDAIPLALLMLSTFALEVVALGVQSEPFDLGRIARNVADPTI